MRKTQQHRKALVAHKWRRFMQWSMALLSICGILVGLYTFALPLVFEQRYVGKNILFVSSDLESESSVLYLASMGDSATQTTLFTIDAAQSVMVESYGEYPLRSVVPLMLIDKKDPWFIRATLSVVLGVVIDEVVVQSRPLQHAEDMGGPINIESLWKEGFSPQHLVLRQIVADAKIVPIQNIVDLVQQRELVRNPQTTKDTRCSVAVVNATGFAGAATNFAELLEKNSFNIVRVVADEQLSQGQNGIYVNQKASKECTSLVERISFTRAMRPAIRQESALRNFGQYRADIVVVLVSDLAE